MSIPLVSSPAHAADGNFNPKIDYPTGANPRSVAVGDFNADTRTPTLQSTPG